MRRYKQVLQTSTTTSTEQGSQKSPFWALIFLLCGPLLACDSPSAVAEPSATPIKSKASVAPAAVPPSAPEPQLGVKDQGIFADLDDQLQIQLPDTLSGELWGLHDPQHKILTLYQGQWPLKVYPTEGPFALEVDGKTLRLRDGDRREVAKHLKGKTLRTLKAGKRPEPGDADKDGIADPLDLLIGAHKTVLNGANYGGGYRRIDYPNGDIPREDGVCTDVVVRAVRNLGRDIQSELQQDIKRRPKAFPMVKKRNPNIDHRRVKTLLPYFLKKWDQRKVALDDTSDPPRPGDIVFMDTFPKRSGPDHIGILSNTRGPSGHLMVINNWTNGFSTSEMDLLEYVPVTHRFRVK